VLELATSSRAPLLTRAQAKPGALLISVTEGQIGGDFVGACHPIFTGLVSIAASNFQREPWASAAKQRDGDGLTELADVLNGKVRARKNPTEVVLFEISAYPPFDLATAQWAYAWAQEHGVGTPLTL
jgi:ornithine cyclodeaminase/alanine dehydrogenase-like protein (mu-crystallin family)